MRIDYICHSCFVIETNGTKIAFDPWITGSAYEKQWHLFPRPVEVSSVENSDIILISHGHEDHLHSPSLKLIQKNAHIFFPFQWRKGIVGYLKHHNFNKITEAVSFKSYKTNNIKITYLSYSLESVIVVECEGYVIVNINDALNSNHETAVNYLLKKIRSQWPKIDFLLSGWSGASYFPNKVHYKNKDDTEVAKIREQYFADNFCRFTKYLQPDIAIPFSPGFVLLNHENRWINTIRFPRQIIDNYYKENFDSDHTIQFPVTYPGDYFTNKSFNKVSLHHQQNGDIGLYDEIDEIFCEEIKMANTIIYLMEYEIQELSSKLATWMNKNKALYDPEVAADAIFSIELNDVAESRFLNISSIGGEMQVVRSNNAIADDRLIIKTRGRLLSSNLDKMWGGDILAAGYGVDITVFDELSLEKNLDIVCLRLITRYPIFNDDFNDNKARIIKYYFRNPSLTNLWVSQKIKLKPYINKYPFNERDHWISYNKCELCKVCNLPELDFEKLQANLNT